MAGVKRIVITDGNAIKALNLMAAMSGEDASDIATNAVMDLWQKKGEETLALAQQLSPLVGHIQETAEQENDENTKNEKE